MINRLNSKEFSLLYERMLEAFPPSEMKSKEEFIRLLDEGKYKCYGYYEENTLMGYALGMLASNDIFWLDYLNIFKEYQSKGCGKKFVSELLDKIALFGILLEVEEPDNDDYNDIQNKRMRFYDYFNMQKVDCPYLFPCEDGTYIDTLNLEYIPAPNFAIISDRALKTAIKEAVGTIHKALPHAQEVMNKYINEVKELKVEFFTLTDINMKDIREINEVGRLIYYTDPYVYPAFFDNDIKLSVKCARSMLKRKTLFNHKHIKVGRINGDIAGFMVILDEYGKENPKEMEKAMKESLGYLTPKFNHVMEGYFNTLDYKWEGRQIMSLAVLPEFRKKRVATKMLNSLSSKDTYTLACVKDNEKARALYKKCGYEFLFEYPGYTGIMCVELIKRGK